MRELLDMPARRMIKILEILNEQPGWITIGDLAVSLDVSERTVSDDISCLRRRWGQFIGLEVSGQKGLHAHHLNTAAMGRVFMDLFHESTALRWLEEIFFFPHNGIEFYEQKLFVSKSTLMRLLPRINRFLATRGIVVRRLYGNFELIASDEQFLRQFFTGFIFELYGLSLKRFEIVFDMAALQDIVQRMIKQKLEPFYASIILQDSISMLFQVMLYVISLVRENQGYTVDGAWDCTGEVSSEELRCIQSYFPDITANHLRPIHAAILRQFCGWDTDAEKELITCETELFFRRIFQSMMLVPDEDMLHRLSLSFESLYLCAKNRPFQTSVLFDRIAYFCAPLKKQNALIYKSVAHGLKLFSQNAGLDMLPRLNDVLYWLCTSCPALCAFIPAKKILVISDFSIQHAKYLAECVSVFFNWNSSEKLTVTPAYAQESIEPNMLKAYDIVITTVPDLPVAHPRIVVINDYPSNENLFSLYQTITGA